MSKPAKRKRNDRPASSAAPVAVEDIVVSNKPAAASAAAAAHTYAMGASCTVRDCLALKSALLDLLAEKMPVTIDMRAVERIDTAALQVLCAFVRDRKAAGGATYWIGGTDSFGEAVRLLGLRAALGVSDANLGGAGA